MITWLKTWLKAKSLKEKGWRYFVDKDKGREEHIWRPDTGPFALGASTYQGATDAAYRYSQTGEWG